MGNGVPVGTQGGTLRSRTNQFEPSRHIFISNARGVITELERLQADDYIIRYHKSSADARFLLDACSWIGFCYRDEHWSFVKR